MINRATVDIESTDDRVTVTARYGDKDRRTYLVREHGAGFFKAWLAIGYTTKLATEAVLR